MTTDLAQVAKHEGIRYFLICFADLFGTLRSKLVPARAIGDMQRDGAGFAGFAAWLDMTPADPDMFAMPDAESLIRLPWRPEVAWLPADLWMNGAEVEASPRIVLKRQIEAAAKRGWELRTGVECEFFLVNEDGSAISDGRDIQEKPCYDQGALMRRYGRHQRDLRLHGGSRLNPYQNDHEDANGQFEMNWEVHRLPRHRRPPRLLPVHGEVGGGAARAPRDVHAEALPRPHRKRMPRPRVVLGCGGGAEPLPRRGGRDGPLGGRIPLPRGRAAPRGRALFPLQTHRQQLQADQRPGDRVGGHLVAERGKLVRQQPHPHGADPGGGTLRASPDGRGGEPLPFAGGAPRRGPRRDRGGTRPPGGVSTSTCTPMAAGSVA